MDFLTIGNITKDLIPGGYTVGGTVTYASVVAMRLGRTAGVLTRWGPTWRCPMSTATSSCTRCRRPIR